MTGAAAAEAISVVVCTRNRPDSLRRCLESLRQVAYQPFEVILVDSASNDREAVRRAVAGAGGDIPIRCLREEQPGLNRARNRGMVEARFGLVAYIDDDVEVSPNWLQALVRAFDREDIAAVTGRVLPAGLETEAQRLFEQYGGMGKGPRARLFEPESLKPWEMLAAHRVGVGANMACRKRSLKAAGGFDPHLDAGTPAGGGGDIDLFHRLLAAGMAISYEPAAVARHHHRREMADLRRQIYNNGRSFGVYLIKTWRAGQIPRAGVAVFAARWFLGWVLKRFLLSLVGLLPFPISLTWAELQGALGAPWAYTATYRLSEKM